MSTRDEVVGRLRTALEARRVVPFIGAGVPAAAGLPGWLGLAAALRSLLNADNEHGPEIDALIRRGQLIDALTAIRDALGNEEFIRQVQQRTNDEGVSPPPLAIAAAQLAPWCSGLITTNLDNLIERASGGNLSVLASAVADLASRSNFLYKMHGTRIDASTWVFTRDQYDRRAHLAPIDRQVFETIYNARTLLFIGYGLSDDDLEPVLARARALSGGQPPEHFALVPTGQFGHYARKNLLAAGLTLIEYSPNDSHREATEILQGLKSWLSRDRSLPEEPQPQPKDVVGDHEFFARTLLDELDRHEELRKDVAYNLSPTRRNYVERDEFFRLVQRWFAEIASVPGNIGILVTRVLPDALMPDGVPADRRGLQYVARRLADCYEQILQWALRWRAVDTDDVFDGLIAICSRMVDSLVAEIAGLPPRLLEIVTTEVTAGEPKRVVNLTLTLEITHSEEFHEELERVRVAMGIPDDDES